LNHIFHICRQGWNTSAKIYLEIKGWMEEKMGETEGSFQGGSIDVMPSEHARARREKMSKAQ
jgi:cobaltochelatase CobN